MSAFQVFARVRPFSSKEQGYGGCIETIDQGSLTVGEEGREITFQLDEVFDETASNYDVFEGAVKSLLNNFLSGINSTVLAYGITGAGKSYTMFGDSERAGLIKLALNVLCQQEGVRLGLSYMEIYNEQVFDLLSPVSRNLAIQDDPVLGVTVSELEEVEVWSAQQALQLIEQGNSRRVVAQTRANEFSSRSHAIVQLSMLRQTQDNTTSTAKLSLVDLAGSERQNVYCQGRGLRNMEGSNINRSLLTLGNCITLLSEKKKGFVPYRDSKLTRLLKDSLGGNTKTVMVACISPSSLTQDETLNTLKYATRARKIQRTVTANTRQSSQQELERQVLRLRQELSLRGVDRTKLQDLITELIQTTEKITQMRLKGEKKLGQEMQQVQLMQQQRNIVSKILGPKASLPHVPAEPELPSTPDTIEIAMTQDLSIAGWERLQDHRLKYRQARKELTEGLKLYRMHYICEDKRKTAKESILAALPTIERYLSGQEQEMIERVRLGQELREEQLKGEMQENVVALQRWGERRSRFAGSLEQVRQMRQIVSERMIGSQQQQQDTPFRGILVEF